MIKYCLHIENKDLLAKLEYFIYDSAGVEYNNSELMLNYSLGNKADLGRLRRQEDTCRLRNMLACQGDCQGCSRGQGEGLREEVPKGEGLKEEELERVVDWFLLLLRTYNMEATLCLEPLMDTVWKSGRGWDCITRLSGVLAAVYLLHFCPGARLLGRKETEENMKSVCRKSIPCYTVEDRRFLAQLFLAEKRFDCIALLLGADLEEVWGKRGRTEDAEDAMWKEFYALLRRLKNGKGYREALVLFQESKQLFDRVRPEVKGWWEKERAGILFRLGQYEEAKNILDRYVEQPEGGVNVYDLYDDAVNYAWAANYKEKDDPEWKAYIGKSYDLTLQAEELILQSDVLEFMHYDVIFEKEFLLSEMGEYDEAYRCFADAFHNGDEDTKAKSNFNTHLWILMKYMCLNPGRRQEILGWIDSFYSHYDPAKLDKYRPIAEFANTSEYLKEDKKLWEEIYAGLMELLFHAMEIRHETKIRDISQYDFLYYTSCAYLRLLLEDESEDSCHYRLPVFHASHMNDPQEGKMLQDILARNGAGLGERRKESDHREIYRENYVFLKAFFCYRKEKGRTRVKEFLPMWVQYGEDAKGCCVVLNNKTFGKTNLRKVVYLSDEGKCDDRNIQGFLDGFIHTYERLGRLCRTIDRGSRQGEECLLRTEALMEMIVSQISYLFKHDSYKHENEVRLIMNRAADNLEDVLVAKGKVPKVYIYNDKQSYIDEIILGAKMENPEDYVPFIHRQGKKMWSGTENQIKVTRSTIQYR